ncbi:MAG: hypothetical protein IJ593_07780, partial [Lachnospiraceae bacterium]|nr:hypothetical protein [Lachnospiraceae bacterium]
MTKEQVRLNIERDNFESLILVGLSIGINYQDIMNSNPKDYCRLYIGKLKMLENEMNNTNILNKIQAAKISQAFFDNDKFNRVDNSIRVLKETDIEKVVRIANADG